MNALTSAKLLDSTALSSPTSDEALIRACERFPAVMDALNNDAAGEDDDGPLTVAYRATKDFIDDTPARTMAGILAKCRAAQAAARDGENGTPRSTPAEYWCFDIVNELLAIVGNGGADGELIQACRDVDAVERRYVAAVYATPADEDPDDSVREVLHERNPFYDRICGLPITSLAGAAALASTIMLECEEYRPEFDNGDDSPSVRLIRHLLKQIGSMRLPTALAQRSSDAELLAACAEFVELQQLFEAQYATLPPDADCMPEDHPAWALLAPLDGLINRIALLPATTPEGMAARLRCYAVHVRPNNQFCKDDPDTAWEDRFRAANLRDAVAALRAGPAEQSAAPDPDAALLARAAEYEAFQGTLHRATGQAAIYGTPECEAHEADVEVFSARETVLFEAMMAMPAYTLAGMQAKARAIRRWNTQGDEVQSLLDDVLREPGEATRPAFQIDTDFLAECANFQALNATFADANRHCIMDDAAFQALDRERGRVLLRIARWPTLALAERQAKARVLQAAMEADVPSEPEQSFDDAAVPYHQVAASLCRDVLREPGA